MLRKQHDFSFLEDTFLPWTVIVLICSGHSHTLMEY